MRWQTMQLGSVAGLDPRTIVPTYSAGLPLMMAVFQGFAPVPSTFV
jgi:hypothetical protein